MIPPFDILDQDGTPLWKECAHTLEEAKSLGGTQPGEYIILSQKTGNKTSMIVGPQSKNKQHQSSAQSL